MVDINELKAEIVRQNHTQKEAYEYLGLTRKQWTDRMVKKKLDSDEIYGLILFLKIQDPMPIFFVPDGT